MKNGASFIDVGGESTAPNAKKIDEKEEWKRIENIIKNLTKNNIPLSLDSYKSEIWEKAVEYNENIIFNDVSGLQIDTDEKIKILQQYPKTKVILMFSRDISQQDPKNIMEEIITFFKKQITLLENAGIEKSRIILDAGMGGFLSKNPEISFEVIKNLEQLQQYNCKILIGTSRKSFLREISDSKNPKNRLISSVITALECIKNGANIVRVHDVKETKEAIEVMKKL